MDLTDMLKGCSCSKIVRFFLRVLFWVPVAFVLLIIIWGYYVYVYILNLSGNFNKPIPLTIFYLLVSHALLFLFITSYLRSIFTTHKEVPDEFCLTDVQLDRLDELDDNEPFLRELASQLPVHLVNKHGRVRYCSYCELIKPDRCHHCSTCGRCVLKMDHHCPWVNNCVGFSNYKYFYLFLTYTIAMCVWFGLSSLYDVISVWTNSVDISIADKFNITFCYIIVIVFGLSTSSLFFFHTYLICRNRTTIENMDTPYLPSGPVRALFNLGVKSNIQAVFGRKWLWALIPIQTSQGDGAQFPLNPHLPEASTRIRFSPRTNISAEASPAHRNSSHEGDQDLGRIEAGLEVDSESEVELYVYDENQERLPLTTFSSDH